MFDGGDDDNVKLFKDINKLREAKRPKGEDEGKPKNDTWAGKLAGHKKFEYLTLGIIVVNALFIGYDTDYSARWGKPGSLYSKEMINGPWGFILMENLFCIYFTFEVVVRFLGYARKLDLFTDWWFLFDGTLVVLMVMETWIIAAVGAGGALSQLSILRLLRLLRITRMGKLMKYFPELQIIVKGMLAAVRSVGCVAILLILIVYVFSILFTSEFHQGNKLDDDEDLTEAQVFFGSIMKSARNLLIMGTILDDITACTTAIRGSNKPTTMLIMFLIFVLISSFTMLNMLIGILVEVVQATGDGERAANTETTVREAIGNLFEQLDEDKNGEIDRSEFVGMSENKHVLEALEDLAIEEKHFHMYAELLFDEEEAKKDLQDEEKYGKRGRPKHKPRPPVTISREQTLDMMLRLRPDERINALDFANFQQLAMRNQLTIKNHIIRIDRMVNALNRQKGNKVGGPVKVESVEQLDALKEEELLAELERRGAPPPAEETSGQEFYSPYAPQYSDDEQYGMQMQGMYNPALEYYPEDYVEGDDGMICDTRDSYADPPELFPHDGEWDAQDQGYYQHDFDQQMPYHPSAMQEEPWKGPNDGYDGYGNTR